MPNHVISKCIVAGKDKNLEELKEFVRSNDSDFDFSKIAPPPEDPAYNDLPSQPVARTSPNWWYTWNCKNWGTKWNCYEVSIGLTVDVLKAYRVGVGRMRLSDKQRKILDLLTGNESSFLLGLEFIKGVKMPLELSFLNKNIEAYSFQTAWNMPDPIFRKLSYKFPDLEFTVLYADEDIGSNCGISTYKNGLRSDILKSVDKDYEKEQYIEFACILNGYNYEDYINEED